MKVWNGLERYPAEAGPVVATIGNFDGVHLGHRAIIEAVVHEARARQHDALLVTFEPHPAAVIAPHRRPSLLQTRRQKLDALADAGLDGVLILAFDERMAAMSAASFLADHVAARVRFSGIRVGSSFRFGHGREGDLAVLEALGRRLGFDAGSVPSVTLDGSVVSSSAVRSAVEAGEIARARRMLGRPYAIEGLVVRGEGRGRDLEGPTANLETDNDLPPRRGVYVTETCALAARYASVTNVGFRPTFDGTRLTVETHLLEFDDDLYGERIEVRFLARLRDERRFESPSDLADQIARDRAAAASYFQATSPTTP